MSKLNFDIDPTESNDHVAKRDKKRVRAAFLWSLAFVATLWWVHLLSWGLGWDLRTLGVYPREWHGLIGILCAPMIHGSFGHLASNTPPMLIMGTMILYAYRRAAVFLFPFVWIASGIAVWLWARSSFHIGASGLAHGMMVFLFVVGIFRRDRLAIVLGMLAFFLYGGMLMTIFPREVDVSFESHLFGAAAGLIMAIFLRKRDPLPPRKKYSWDYEEEAGLVDGDWEKDSFEPPRPEHVPILWNRPSEEDQRKILEFPTRRDNGKDEPPTVH